MDHRGDLDFHDAAQILGHSGEAVANLVAVQRVLDRPTSLETLVLGDRRLIRQGKLSAAFGERASSNAELRHDRTPPADVRSPADDDRRVTNGRCGATAATGVTLAPDTAAAPITLIRAIAAACARGRLGGGRGVSVRAQWLTRLSCYDVRWRDRLAANRYGGRVDVGPEEAA